MNRFNLNIEQLCALANRYSVQLPRYTSYPTAVSLQPCQEIDFVQPLVESAAREAAPLSLYVHVPFCPTLCYFCACSKIITQDKTKKREYLQLLRNEVEYLRTIVEQQLHITQLHLGGGSPSYLSPDELFELDELTSHYFRVDPTGEKSIEIDPRTMTEEKARVLSTTNFSRVSIGVQDFDPHVQEIINRIQPFSLVADTVSYLRQAGFQSINFDLVYGLPGQTEESFKQTIEAAISLRPQRIALYGYAHVQWKVKVQKVFEKHPLPDAILRLKLFHLAKEIFIAHGYVFVGLDHFALPDDDLAVAFQNRTLRRNFMGYTTLPANGVLGIGPSAISDLRCTLFQNSPNYLKYSKSIQDSHMPVEKVFTRSYDDILRGSIIEKIMCFASVKQSEIVDEGHERDVVEKVFADAYEQLRMLENDGLIEQEREKITVTPLGRYFLRAVASVFDRYLVNVRETKPQTFSQGV